jgi:hypothetical protein
MVAMTVGQPRGIRLRPARDPARPVGAWLPVALVTLGIALSLLGWATADRLGQLQDSAQRNATSASVSERQASLADLRADLTADQRDGLRALVVHRCDTGQVRDAQLCDAARKIAPAR